MDITQLDSWEDLGIAALALCGSPETAGSRLNDPDQPSTTSADAVQRVPLIGGDGLAHFSRTELYQSQTIQTELEALEALSKDECDAEANQFMGWWCLTQQNDTLSAISHLELAIQTGTFIIYRCVQIRH